MGAIERDYPCSRISCWRIGIGSDQGEEPGCGKPVLMTVTWCRRPYPRGLREIDRS